MTKLRNGLVLTMILLLGSVFTIAQATTGSLSGTVTDPSGAVVAGATIVAHNNATGQERTATTNENGVFNISQLSPASYTVTITATGFKKSVAPDVKVNVGLDAALNLALEIGGMDAVVTVNSAQEVINTSSPSLTTVINTRQVVDLPLTGRNPVELAGLQAGVAVVGQNVRGASVSGTRQTAVNLTQDGINAMDNFVKTSSFFALTTPSLNATQEFSVTTGTAGAENGRGVAQVNMVTKSGSNQYHGGAFLQLINDWAYANTFFNNTTGTPKPRLRQHYAGMDIGGPVHFLGFGEGVPKHWNGKDKAFFFFSYERFKQQQAATRNRSVMTQEARSGTYRYVGNNGQLQTVDLLGISSRGFGINPIMTAYIAQTPLPNNDECGGDSYNIRCFKFNVTENTTNDKYVARYDHQLVKNSRLGSHKLEFVFSRVITATTPDVFTNGVEAPFPGGVNAFQSSVRNLVTPALVSTFGSRWTNTLRYGRQWAPVIFDRDSFPTQPFIVLSGVTTPDNRNLAQPRNTIVNQINDHLSYIRGNHLFKFGADFQRVLGISQNDAGIVETITLGGGNGSNGPGFVQTTLPFSTGLSNSSTILANATSIYANITGLLSSATQTFNVTSPTSGFVPGATRLRTVQNSDLGLYAQDQWRFRPNLTLNLGVRWEFMGVPTIPNGLAIQPKYQDIYGISGFGNLFKPTAAAGVPPAVATLNFVSGKTGIGLYKNDWNNFAPNLGFAWQPSFKGSLGRFLFGGEGKSSIRGGYSISYIHDGITTVTNALGTGSTNPGLIAVSTQTTLLSPASNILQGVLTSAGVPLVQPSFKIPITDRDNILAGTGNGLWTFDPNLRSAYIQQWNFGIEREVMKDTALEVRYVGNYGGNLWRAIDINGEPTIVENGFLQEFLNAQKNLAARGGTSFAPGCTGCVALPIFDKFFGLTTGGVAVSTASGYGSSAFISNLNNNNIGTMAFSLANSSTYRTNRESATVGLPANFFLPNPNANFAAVLQNGSKSWYNALQVELRRRYSHGLQFQADYTWSKAMVLGDAQGNNQSDFVQPLTFHNLNLDKRRSSQDQTQRFVSNAIYDLPFGHGKAFFGDAGGFADRIVGGWTIGAIATWATGNPWYVTSGRTTINAYGGAGAQMGTMSFADFKKNVGLYRTGGGIFFINPDLLNITTNSKGVVTAASLKPGLIVAPAPGTLGNFPVNSLSGPKYFSLDMSLTKRIPITERVRMEFKATAINVLNHANFSYGSQNFDSTSFGRVTSTLIGGRQVNFIGQIRF